MQGTNIYNVHTDQIGTPRVITNSANTVVWKWDNTDPFGKNLPSVSTLNYNIRFAGQYFDNESNLHYNYYRTYNPLLGRYIQPDPTGLQAGFNLYNYVAGNPMNSYDKRGLDSEHTYVMSSPYIKTDDNQNMRYFQNHNTVRPGIIVLVSHADEGGIALDLNSQFASHLNFNSKAVQEILNKYGNETLLKVNAAELATLIKNSNIDWQNSDGFLIMGCYYGAGREGQAFSSLTNKIVLASPYYVNINDKKDGFAGYSYGQTSDHRPINPVILDSSQMYKAFKYFSPKPYFYGK